ncbi:hypothetical protein AB0P15_36300 [Streptomyces sp. NPDC087917]|uniref:hypothetical protein n=1 Tax=Streptomyces sp. NPDC087917 TaxID=3155060 RepID=UPI0034286ABF
MRQDSDLKRQQIRTYNQLPLRPTAGAAELQWKLIRLSGFLRGLPSPIFGMRIFSRTGLNCVQSAR